MRGPQRRGRDHNHRDQPERRASQNNPALTLLPRALPIAAIRVQGRPRTYRIRRSTGRYVSPWTNVPWRRAQVAPLEDPEQSEGRTLRPCDAFSQTRTVRHHSENSVKRLTWAESQGRP